MSSPNSTSRNAARAPTSGASNRSDGREGKGSDASHLLSPQLVAPDELEIVRHLFDTRARAEVSSAANRRQALMQRLLARIHILSDREFESAYHALDGMIETFTQAKANGKSADKGNTGKDVVSEAQASLEKTMEKSMGRTLPGITRIQGT
ncbi:MAG: hypothetical protein IOD12_13340 [Silvanigrellales bacterium]|jgi:hypothetical protein|nr:hypothetical protein [Silvanigrellales bacterium]